ncbi:Lon family ATP-dependent protease [Thermotalea metallivorans]|uniref:endopeptidase La n=1 Tax=Thermotalea metallivorans TaxID=520762 RepID=A0A140L026_9FIRM|nr:Lon family ATP-dependent protease [Thermotalea metallivorans]KXG73901.1 Lon protease 2 [Thermotalea metallivorans]
MALQLDQHPEMKDMENFYEKISESGLIPRKISALYHILNDVLGTEKVSKKIQETGLQELIHSEKVEDRILALHRIVFDSEESEEMSKESNIKLILSRIEEKIADILARKTVEYRIERETLDKLERKQKQYMEEIKMQILKSTAGPENAYTFKKYALLEKLESKKLTRSAMELFRPQRLEDIEGQDKAIKSLVSKIASPFPQHIIIYGPPGVGKTTAARLALEYAKKMKHTPFAEDAKFVEVDGTTLRWDPREITNPLLGSVHDPIYQGSKKDLAEVGIPEPKPGLVTEAHGGVLFIDEIGELDIMLQNKLLKVLEDKRVEFESAYYDPDNPAVPLYVKKLFHEGAPADFILIGATTRQPHEINGALRSRCAEVYFEPLTAQHIQDIVKKAAERLSVKLDEEVAEIISQYTVEGRKAINLLSDAYSMALYEQGNQKHICITKQHIFEVVQMSRLTPVAACKASNMPEIGKVFGLGVNGFLGSVLELECVVFQAAEKGRGSLRLNDTAGAMTKDSFFNGASLVRRMTGELLSDYDVHVNVIGGGNIDGPSAGAAIVTAIISAIQNRKIRQDTAVTGEISLRGRIKPVGGINEKIYGAKQAGMKKVIIPRDNVKDVHRQWDDMEIIPVETIEEVLQIMFVSVV